MKSLVLALVMVAGLASVATARDVVFVTGGCAAPVAVQSFGVQSFAAAPVVVGSPFVASPFVAAPVAVRQRVVVASPFVAAPVVAAPVVVRQRVVAPRVVRQRTVIR